MPPCAAGELVASLAPGGVPDYPPFEVVPAGRPVRATVANDGGRLDLFLYPAEPTADAADRGRLIAADANSGAVRWDSSRAAGAARPASLEHAPALLVNNRGVAYRAYFGDGAGGIWRLDLPPGPTTGWSLDRLASLEGLASGVGAVAFPVAPDLFLGVDGTGRPFDGLVLSALIDEEDGRRIDLLLLRDYALDEGQPEKTLAAEDLVAVRACDTVTCPPASGPGWYLAAAAPGDALAVAPLIDGGRIFLATHTRLSLSCEDATAERFVVVVDLERGEPVLEGDQAGGFALGRQRLEGPRPVQGAIHSPGLREALERRGLGEERLVAEGLILRRRYWLDLLLDAD
ncbi:pilus assembly protein [Pseudohaliea rubra]|nr:hypothetical protein [Pseudohaliea rubra]